ncbi:MAG: FMN-binding protein [Pseudolysinimonas sp.]
MRARAVAASVLASAGILIVGWQVGTAGSGAPVASTTTSGGTASAGSTAGTTSTGSSGALKDGTYTGTTEQTRFGNVEVQVTVAGSKITDVKALRLTDREQRSVQISNYAAPILRQEVLASQSAKVSNVNGATYTTDGYLSSLQSALDQAQA